MFTEKQKNILIGLLLGDGSLRKYNKNGNASLKVKRSAKDISYLEYHAKIFEEHLTKSKISSESYFDIRYNKRYNFVKFTSKSLNELTNYYKKWYPNGKKIIPNDLELNSEIIATWFCDDGSIEKSKNGYFRITLCTNCFTHEEVNLLKSLLEKRYSARVGISKAKGNQLVLKLSDYAARKLITDLDPVFPEGMERKRKWDSVSFGKEHFSHVESCKDKQNKVEEFIKNNNSFYLMDITKYAGSLINRSDGRVEWCSQNIKRYLKQGIIKFDYKDRKGNHYSKIL